MSIVKTGSPSSGSRTSKPFIQDIEPFFYKKPVIYVDVGAYSGGVFREVFHSGLKPIRSYLIEPNPTSYARLKETVAALEAERVATCYNLALGAEAGTLRLRAQDTMTRVLAADSAETEETEETDFDIPARTLDALAAEFVAPHVSLLKIDVEGFETEVLAGAAGLLAAQAVDMIYIEAGLDAENPQQTYYREIEDSLRVHGYRLFRIYEQHHEWATDLPVLRRVNLAFISGKFAEGNPLRLSKELFTLHKDHDELQRTLAQSSQALETRSAELAAARVVVEERVAECEAARVREAELAERATALEAEMTEHAKALEAATWKTAEGVRQLVKMKSELDSLKSYGRILETRHLNMLESNTWQLMEPARRTIRYLTGKRPPVPFTPQLIDRPVGSMHTAAAAPTAKLSGTEAPKAAAQLMALAGKRDYPGLLAKEALFARSEKLDQFFFLRRFSRLLALKAHSAFSEAAEVHEQTEARLGAKHVWLAKFFGSQTYLRYVIDASTALTRVGRLDAARRLVDGALERLDGSPALLRHRAEMLWPYAPDEARADLVAAAAKAAPARGSVLLGAYLDVLAAGAAADPNAFGDRMAEHPEMALAAVAAASGSGDFPAYRGWLNRYFEAQGLIAPLSPKIDRFAFDALATGAPATRDGPLVSVVMTTYNTAGTLDYAVRSLTAQTHANLEILIVDDCSIDDTRDRLAALAAADPRIRILLNTENVGTYVSKNRAIAEAKGDYVTLHDSDDWAHPERIARHVAVMAATPALAATRSEWLRLDGAGALHFRRWGCKFQHPNPASTFIRRSVLDKAGYFDSVRYGADSEYWFRLNRLFPGQVKSLPLCLGLGYIRAESLTQSGSGAMDLENYSPVRGAYAAAYLDWHAAARPAEMKLPPRLAARPFLVPAEMAVAPPEGASAGGGRHAPAAKDKAEAPEFMFGISLASRQVSADWDRTQELLGHTLRSLLNQRDPRFSVVICGHERPALAELGDPRVLFVESDQGPPKKSTGFRGDKMRKRRLAGLILRERGGGYFFPLDADDLVHRDMVAHALRDDNRRGYLLDTGYAFDYENHVLAPVPGAWSVAFDRACGSSAAIYFEPEDLPVNGELDEELYFNLFQSHAYWPIVAEEYARPLDRVPFAGGVYVVNHAQNLSFRLQRKGLRTENIVKSIARHRVDGASDVLSAEFGLFLGEQNQNSK